MPEVDVIILTWNDGAVLDAAVRSARCSVGVVPTVLVVDNGSDIPAVVSGDHVQLVRNEVNVGVSRGRNQGAGLGHAEFVCFLDSDAELAGHSVRAMVDVLGSDRSIAVAVPVFAGQLPESSAGRKPNLGVKLARALGRRSTYSPVERPPDAAKWDVDFGIGACQLIRRSVFEEVGGLDEDIFYGPEDVDFCLRVRSAGYRVVQVDGLDVRHPPRRAFRRPLTVRGLRHGWSVVRHLWRHRGTPTL